jgi:iron complex outermembrane receptor protein
LDFAAYLDESRSLVPSVAELDERRLSPYLLLEHLLSNRFTVSGGVRYEWVRYEVDAISFDRSQLSPVIVTNRGTFPNPNFKKPPDVIDEGTFGQCVRQEGMAAELSVNFRLNEEWSLFAGYDRTYRYPVFDERASYQGFPLAEDVNGSLGAEEGNNFEVGMKFVGRRHEVYLTTFLLEMENEIFFDPTVSGSNPAATGLNVNLGPVERYGLDLLYRYDAVDWGVSFQFAHVSTEMQAGVGEGEEVPLVPRWVMTSQIWWEPRDWLRLRAIHRYVDERFEGSDFLNEKRTVEAYQLVDLSADFKVAPNCRVFIKVENVFDELYAETAVLDVYYPGNGRFFELGVKLDF